MDGRDLAIALDFGVAAAYKAVMKPSEGTILTVSRLAAARAAGCARENNDVEAVLEAAIQEGHVALADTVNLNPVLKKAGVVDAGGKGFLVILQGMLDELRGLAVLLMIFYHGAYDAVYIFRFTGSGWFTSAPMDFLQRYIAVSFILIAGIMGRYSRSNFRRGVKTFLCGLLVTAVTLLVMPSERILFGILHFLGAAMMLLGLCEPLLRKIPAAAGVLLSAVLYLATDSIGQGWIGLGPVQLELPRRT